MSRIPSPSTLDTQGTAVSEAAFLDYYDTSRITAIYGRRPFLLLRRLLQIVQTFGRWFALRYIDGTIGRSDQMFKVRAAELRSLLVELGPVRFCQTVAQAISSPAFIWSMIYQDSEMNAIQHLLHCFPFKVMDIIPPAYLEELSFLQDQIAPFSSEVAFSIMEQELGLPIDMLFSEISPNPVAAASLGQAVVDERAASLFQALDAFGVAAFNSMASRAMTLPFPLPLWSYNTMEEDDISNLRTLNRRLSLLGKFSRNKSPSAVGATQANGITDIDAETRTPEEEALLVLNQLSRLQDLLPSTFAVLSEVSPEARQEVLLMPADITGRLASRIVTRTIRRIIV